MRIPRSWLGLSTLAAAGLFAVSALGQDTDNKNPKQEQAAPAKPGNDTPATESEAQGPVLKTTPVLKSAPLRNLIVVDSSPLPRDEIVHRKALAPGLELEQLPPEKQKFWILDFAFKPVRMIDTETPKGRKKLYYLYYRVINHTGEPRMFVPQFTLVTDDGKVYNDIVLPRAVDAIERREQPKALQVIQAREDISIPLLGAVDIMGVIPPSKKQGVDDAVYGVAIWEMDDAIARADSFSIYVQGLSDGSYPDKRPDGTPAIRYKTLRLDFAQPGDERNRNENEIRPLDPSYHWEYLERPSAFAKAKAASVRRS